VGRALDSDTNNFDGVELFVSYAHRDTVFMAEFEKHLVSLKRTGLIRIWHDGLVQPGSSWMPTLDDHLNSADIIILLISPDFLSSDFCYERELRRALERRARGDAEVVPIIVRPTDWQTSIVGELQALPKDGVPITAHDDQDEAFVAVVKCIRGMAERLIGRKSRVVP
jgi:hypothetical protein